MSTSAIILMIIGCAGLWGGFAVSCYINFKSGAKTKKNRKANNMMKQAGAGNSQEFRLLILCCECIISQQFLVHQAIVVGTPSVYNNIRERKYICSDTFISNITAKDHQKLDGFLQ